MTTREPFDIDGMDDVTPENIPGHIVNPDAWRARPSAGAHLEVIAAVVVWAVVMFVVLWQIAGPR